MSNRNVRVSELIKREVSDILHTRYQRETVAITINRVDVSPDHSNARVYYSNLTSESDSLSVQRFLDRIAGKVRFEVGKRVVLKRLPSIGFFFDERIEEGNRVNEIIDSFQFEESSEEV